MACRLCVLHFYYVYTYFFSVHTTLAESVDMWSKRIIARVRARDARKTCRRCCLTPWEQPKSKSHQSPRATPPFPLRYISTRRVSIFQGQPRCGIYIIIIYNRNIEYFLPNRGLLRDNRTRILNILLPYFFGNFFSIALNKSKK